jgi:hypothetical protein
MGIFGEGVVDGDRVKSRQGKLTLIQSEKLTIQTADDGAVTGGSANIKPNEVEDSDNKDAQGNGAKKIALLKSQRGFSRDN